MKTMLRIIEVSGKLNADVPRPVAVKLAVLVTFLCVALGGLVSLRLFAPHGILEAFAGGMVGILMLLMALASVTAFLKGLFSQ